MSSASEGGGELGQAIASHQASRRERAGQDRPPRRSVAAPRRETGDRDRRQELQGRHGWAWLRPFRRLDEYERALSELAEADERHARRRQPV